MPYNRTVLIEEVQVLPKHPQDLLILTCRTSKGGIFETALTVNRDGRPKSRPYRNLILVRRMLATYGIDEADEYLPRLSWSRLAGLFFRMQLEVGNRPKPTDANPRPRRPVYIKKVKFARIVPFDVCAMEEEAVRALDALIKERQLSA